MLQFLHKLVDWFANGDHWHSSNGIPGVPALILGQIELVLLSVGIAMVVALPLGLWLGHIARAGFLAINVANIGRALPSIAILFVAVQVLGIGRAPALVALVALSMPPILTNTYVGIRGVDRDMVDAARGMGMSEWQILSRVEMPTAVATISAGVRTATVQSVATATLAGFVGYNCLGTLINLGLNTGDHVTLFAGGLLVVALALVAEYGLAALERRLTPAGLRRSRAATSAQVTVVTAAADSTG